MSPAVDLDLDRLAGLLVAEDPADVFRSEANGRLAGEGHHPVAGVESLAGSGFIFAGKGPGDDEGREPADLEKFSPEAELPAGASSARPLQGGRGQEGGEVELADKRLEGLRGERLDVDLGGVDELAADHLDELFERVALHLATLDLEIPDSPGELFVFALQLFELVDEIGCLAVEPRRPLKEQPGEGAAFARLAAELPDEGQHDGVERPARAHAPDRQRRLRANLEAAGGVVHEAQQGEPRAGVVEALEGEAGSDEQPGLVLAAGLFQQGGQGSLDPVDVAALTQQAYGQQPDPAVGGLAREHQRGGQADPAQLGSPPRVERQRGGEETVFFTLLEEVFIPQCLVELLRGFFGKPGGELLDPVEQLAGRKTFCSC